MKNFRGIYLIPAVIIPLFCAAQSSSSNGIAFIEFNPQACYVIDSLEHKKCNCIDYVDKRYFSHAALVQLPDSHVVLRIKRVNHDGYTDVPMTPTTVSELHAAASVLNDNTEGSHSNEEAMLKAMAETGVEYHLIKYDQLRFPVPRPGEVSITASTQPEKDKTLIFFEAGVGFGRANHDWGDLALGLEFGYVFKRNILTIRNFKVTETSGPLGDIQPHENTSDYGLLYGRTLDCGRVLLTASAGVSYTRGLIRGDFQYSTGWFGTSYYDETNFSTIGFPVQVELFVGARRDCNVSFNVFSNFNSEHNFWGVLICLRFGAVKQMHE